MLHLLNADLHSHSTVSDGTLAPQALAERAHAAGVQVWALTDHDEIGGQRQAREAALDLGMAWLSGTEISVSFAGETVHIVGLGFDLDDESLRAGLQATRDGRLERARAMAADLERVGVRNAFDGALSYVGNPDLISRTHFARHIVAEGHCAHTHEVFHRYLTPGKPGYVPHRWASLRDAVSWIQGAGGVAVIAHPARYRLSPNADWALFIEFKALGGQAVEVITGNHSVADQLRYGDTAREFGLAASRGSDFHGPGESRVDLGALPDLPGTLTPVWQLLQPRIEGLRTVTG